MRRTAALGCLVIAGCFGLSAAFGGVATPRHILVLLAGGSAISLTGGIDLGTDIDLERLLKASPDVRTLEVANLGGSVGEAMKIRDLIRRRRLATYTDGLCASACTVVFMGGAPRLLGPHGRLGFHRYVAAGMPADLDAAMNGAGERDLIRSGVSPDFAARVFQTPSTDLWIPDRATLTAAGVISGRSVP
jgi:hypothetical protein